MASDSNSFFGTSAGLFTTAGSNSFFGATSGISNTSGTNNSFFGRAAGDGNTTGQQNSFFGTAGRTNVGGSNNTAIGYQADVGSANLNFATAIGASATVSTSNTIALGRSNGTDAVQIPGALNVTGPINGTVSNATTAINALQLGGLAANQYVQTTDGRLSDARNPLPGSSNYIQNGLNTQPSSNLHISGSAGVGSIMVDTNLAVGNNANITGTLTATTVTSTGVLNGNTAAVNSLNATGGITASTVSTSSNISVGGRLGVGTTPSTYKLEVIDPTSNGLPRSDKRGRRSCSFVRRQRSFLC